MKTYVQAPRYSLIIETKSNDIYYFNVDIGNFVKVEGKDTPTKSTLPALDLLTTSFANLEELAEKYSIPDINKIYITYKNNGEHRLKVAFNSNLWQHVAFTYNGRNINFNDKKILEAFNEMYHEIANLKSGFYDKLINNEKKLIHLSSWTINALVNLRAHEQAIRNKNTYDYGLDEDDPDVILNDIYSEDRYGYYQDLQKRCYNYREFRTLYFNYCNYLRKKKNQEEKQKGPAKKLTPKKVPVIPPHQISMFDSDYPGNV